jgi:hypothetical protein
MVQPIPLALGPTLLEEWATLHSESICDQINEKGSFIPAAMVLAPHPEEPAITIQLGTGIWKFLAPNANADTTALRQQLQDMLTTVIRETRGEVLCLSLPAFVAETPEARDRIANSKRADGSIDRDAFEDDDEVYEVIYYIVETPKQYVVRMFIVDRDESDKASIACELEANPYQLSLLPHYLADALEGQ